VQYDGSYACLLCDQQFARKNAQQNHTSNQVFVPHKEKERKLSRRKKRTAEVVEETSCCQGRSLLGNYEMAKEKSQSQSQSQIRGMAGNNIYKNANGIIVTTNIHLGLIINSFQAIRVIGGARH
jgi:hypothetical protein